MDDREEIIGHLFREKYVLVNGKTDKNHKLIIETLEKEGLVTCTQSRFEKEHVAFIVRGTDKLNEYVRQKDLK